MKGKIRIIFMLIVLCFFSAALNADTIRLAADSWMPFNGDGKTETGYILDIAREIFEKAGHTVIYETVPWSRAIAECAAGRYEGIIGATVDDAPDFVFPSIEQGISATEFSVKKGSTWKYQGIKSLENVRLAVIKDYAYFENLDAYILENAKNKKRIDIGFGETALETNLKKLTDGKVDVLVDDSYVIGYSVNKAGIKSKVESAGIGSIGDQIFIAFSPVNAKSSVYAKLLADGLTEMRKSGKLKVILSKYGLVDWK